ncbi:PAS domain S-box protein [Methylomicrobium sp. Wu6]|uniref:PAS domain S-box protein n=1 Tax=Methylomicrobium sp. Wu6 TaxID=3107928 RepID=UPI002DD62BBF|nr:PAS domain S-box protein [Methylomicrobium sp. Wu6]MEC4749833.1 PAS domain S-box protein [Methylomicrobium sp. Wu6]
MPYFPSRFSRHLASSLGGFSPWSALFVMLISLLVLGGWIWDVAALKAILPGWATMKPLTAIGLLLAGAALWLLHRNENGLLQRRLGLSCSALVALIGGLILLEYEADINSDLDPWLFRDSVLAEGGLYPGRPSPSTAFCLLLSGISLMAMDLNRVWLASLLALQILLICLLALVGYAYGVSALYRIEPYASIAMHTAVLLFMLALGILSARPEPFLSRLTSPLAGSLMARRLLPAAILFPFAVGRLQLANLHAGIYGADFGWALFTTLYIIVFSALIYWTAGLLNRADAGREATFAALRESEERFRLLVDASPNGVLMAGVDGRIRLANHRAETLLGFAAGQLLGLPIETRIKHRLSGRRDWLRDAFAAGPQIHTTPPGHELSCVRQDDSEFPVEMDLNPLETREGSMLLITFVDITERKRTEEDRSRFVALANGSTEFIGMCDKDFNPFYVNPAGLRLVGFESLTAANAVQVQDFFFPEDQTFITEEFFPRVVREGHAEVEIRFRHFQTGEAIWMLYNVFNLRDTSGAITGWATVSRNIHDRKRLEARFRAAIECAPTGMVMIDGEGEIVLVNAQTEHLFGYERNELLGQTVEILLPEHFRAKHPPQRKAFFCAPEARRMGHGRELFGRRKDGSEVPVEIGLNPLRTDEGPFVLAAIVDITERKRAEAASRESEERFRLMVEGVQDYAIFMLDPKGRIISWNVGSERITGYEAGEIIGRHFSLFYTEQDAAAKKPALELEEATREGRYVEEALRVRKDGSHYWANVILTALRDSAGKLRGFAKVTQDITERKQAEEKILRINSELEERVACRTRELETANVRLIKELAERHRAEAETDQFFTMSADLICIVGADGRLRRVNTAFETTLDYSLAELSNRPLLNFVHPDDLPSTLAEMEKLARGEPTIRYENRYRCKDGFYKWLGWTSQPAPGYGFYAIARDITERKLDEARIATSLHEKEVLLKEIHHRVKNNLQVIASLLRLQADTLADPAARELFMESQRRVRSMALVHEQLYQSSGLANINMPEYISSLVNYIRRSYSHSPAAIRFRIEIADIELDIERAVPLGLIISELVANGFKHAFRDPPAAPAGELRVILTSTEADDLTLEVGDNGCGIPDGVEIDKPSSMGLHLVQSFVLQLNGRMTVQRQPHAVFSIVIPVKKVNHV